MTPEESLIHYTLVSSEEANLVYLSLSVLTAQLEKEHVAEYFTRPCHDDDTYRTFKNSVAHLQKLLRNVASK